jgi:hypothetical protein
MRKITWLFAKERNTDHSSFQARSIFKAFARIQRYWSVDFQQVNSRANLSIILSANKRPYPAWQQGKSIYFSANYKWINHEQAVLAFIHEFGHWLINGGGHIKNQGFVMSEIIGDPYINFGKEDMRWFNSLPWSSKLRPWDEPNYFRPLASQLKNPDNINCSCEHNKSIIEYFIWPKVLKLEIQ